MRRKLIMALCLGLCTSGSIKLALAEDMTVNRLLASQCAQCHGTNGHAVGDMDGLSDESYKDLYEDLMDMRSEDRPEDIMDHQALGYTNDQIRRIAAYYGMRSGKGGEQPEGVDESEEQKGGNDSEHQEEGLMQEREKRQKENQRERKKRNREKDDD
jgi:sulfide dehydrogenase cytochrome subunit